jgi:TRAP-type C4-dicarboxylate transport system substrate-binding protein
MDSKNNHHFMLPRAAPNFKRRVTMKRTKVLVTVCSFTLIIGLAVLFSLTPQQALAEKPIELSFALHIPSKAAPYPNAFLPWAQEIEKRTDGRLKIKFYLSQTLVKARDSYDGVVNGIADISWGSQSWTGGRFPLSSVMGLPFLSPDTFVGAHALNDLYKKFPEIQKEYEDVHLLFLWVTLPYEIHTVKKPVRTIADMQGLKMATQPAAKAALEGLKAVPVTMPTPKIYQTVEKGVADGSALAWGAYKAWKLVEVTKYHTNVHLGGVPFWTAMNKNTWAKLPKDIQAIITAVTAEMMPDKLCGAVTNEMKQAIEITNKRGQEIINISAAERAKWAATGKPAWDKWVKTMEAKGLPGRAVLDEAVKLVK